MQGDFASSQRVNAGEHAGLGLEWERGGPGE